MWEWWVKKAGVADTYSAKAEFRGIFKVLRLKFGAERAKVKSKLRRRREARRQHRQMSNVGYTEDDPMPPVESELFAEPHLTNSMVEDRWKAEYYLNACNQIDATFPPRAAAISSDCFNDILRLALRLHARDEVRPVLTHELADSPNPYTLKRAALERLLHHGVVRNKLEESLVEKFLDASPGLAKLRASADAPPELTEPLAAFRGLTDWSCDPRERLRQKLVAINLALDGAALPPPVWRFKHPFRNHFGFASAAPFERTGGWNVGRPQSRLDLEMKRMRYPTLQRVAHSLPKDPVYRSSVIQSINVLERSKGWELEDKTRAVNTMKEIYDSLPSSKLYKENLEKALPVKRPNSRQKGAHPLKTFPIGYSNQGKRGVYHKSFVATKPLWQRVAERAARNLEQKQKKQKRSRS